MMQTSAERVNTAPGKPEMDAPTSGSHDGERGARPPGVLFFTFGVAFPLLVIGVEMSTGMCAAEFFDPIPSIWHVMVATSVPLVNLALWLLVRRNLKWNTRVVGVANGFAIGAAFYYTALFLPLLPLALVGIIVLIGLLPMAPLFSLIAALRGRTHLKRFQQRKGRTRVGGLVPGLAVFLLVMVCIDAQSTLTRICLKMAASDQREHSLEGIRLLRAFGKNELLLRACYKSLGLAPDLVGVFVWAGDPVSPHKVREIYYRVTGESFNSVSPPLGVIRRGAFVNLGHFDAGLGGDSVAGRVGGLTLLSSRIDGSVDPNAALAYVEWTLEFRNDSIRQREARAQIQLPPGGVVSRLTLWIDGEEREAVFAGRARVSNAYKKVVAEKRDPILVTTQGPDRILLQCFPVPPHGGIMKTRIGITAPVMLLTKREGNLRLPRFLERNFSLDASCRHNVWIESRGEVRSVGEGLSESWASSEVSALRGALSDAELTGKSGVVRVMRSEDRAIAWAADKTGHGEAVILQTIATKKTASPQRVVLVVDGSAAMRHHIGQICQAVARMPAGLDCTVLVAADEVLEVATNATSGDSKFVARIERYLKKLDFVGGCDNVPALELAWRIAAAKPDSVVVWIHGPQPILMRSPAALVQHGERGRGDVAFFETAVGPGANRVVEKLGSAPSVRSVPRLGDLKDDLARLFSRWMPGAEEIVHLRQRISKSATGKDVQPANETSSHLSRLWANDRIAEILLKPGKKGADVAAELAIRYRLVTPLTGAVVLENAEQYKRAGLTPPSPDSVPTIPEPETYVLVIVALLGLAWVIRFRRQKWHAA